MEHLDYILVFGGLGLFSSIDELFLDGPGSDIRQENYSVSELLGKH